MWGDPEQRLQKKVNKTGRRAGWTVGLGIGCWFLAYLYPHEGEKAEIIANIFGQLGWLLLFQGTLIIALLVINKKWALRVNMLMVWFVIPTCVFYIFVNNWPG